MKGLILLILYTHLCASSTRLKTGLSECDLVLRG